MEKVKVLPEDLQCKFKSKEDLYRLHSVDLEYHLPPYEKCPVHFLREVLSGEKIIIKAVKKEEVRHLEVPRYRELSVPNIWALVVDVPFLTKYFPTFQPNQLPDRDYMFSILATHRYDVLHSMIQNARKNRSIKAPESDSELVHISKKIYDEIMGVSTQKLSRGKVTHLLKRSAKLLIQRKAAKTYELNFENFENFDKEEEEAKEGEDMS